MADTADNTGTTATIAVGGSYTDWIETSGDHDWVRLDLRAGQSVAINAASSGSSGLSDPVVTLRDSAGTVLRTVDTGTSENFFFTATAAGTYYLDVSGFENGTGQYTIGVSNYVRPSTEVANEWHLPLLGDMAAVWADYTGRGVHVGIYDTGVQYTHHDLDGNYDASRHVTVNGQVLDPTPSTDGHGTSVAGLIASEDDGVGTKGVAYGAGITGVRIYGGPADMFASDPSGFLQAIDQSENFDVINHSWGRPSSFVGPQFNAQVIAEWFEALADGRGGLGTVQVNSAGNENRNSEGISYKNTRATIVVGAYDDTGDAAVYSSFGANLLVSAPSNGGTKGLVTTDLLGDDGYEPGDYTDKFGGTSGATPIVTGVVALMMEANANLGWRDVREILGLSATSVGSGVGGTKTRDENDRWFFNNAATWNGGGLHFSRDYGFGAVNAYNAVRMAEAWSLFDAPGTSANESRATVGTTGSTALADNGSTSVAFDFAGVPFSVESVDVSVDITHAKLDSLVIELVSATGAVVKLFDRDYNQAGTNLTWSFNANAFLGEHGQGIWTVRITDTAAGNTGTLNSASVTLNGNSLNLADDVYHYTDEFSETVALAGQGGRTVLSDTDGGVDWLEAAAVRTNTTVNLKDGTATIDGVALTLSGIENVLTGDGNDDLTGDDGSNRLVGMRGNDTLRGGSGDDTLEGGAGADRLFGDDGIDTISYVSAKGGVTVDIDRSSENTGDAAGDLYANVENILGSAFDDTLRGAAENNRIVGGAGNDTLLGRGGDDVLVGGVGSDLLDGGEGIDTISYADATTGVTADIDQSYNNIGEAAGDGYTNVENLLGSIFDDILRGAAEDNYIEGGAGNDTLDGRGGADILRGGAGSDIYYVENVGDLVFEAAGDGRDIVNAVVSFAMIAGQEIEELRVIDKTTKFAIDLTGNEFANKIVGNAGANLLDGRGGNDALYGEAGNDTYLVDRAGDQAFEAVGRGRDVVNAAVSYTLSAGQEIEELRAIDKAAKTTLALTGNEFANKIVGDAGNNRLDGGGGADSLHGGAGSDTYLVDNAGDQISESTSGGWDSVATTVSYTLSAGQEIEELRILLSAGDAPIHLTGNALTQNLIGNNAANTLNGGWGNDVLTGRGGADTFVFSNAPGTGNIDRITDFATEDTIQLSSSIFTALAPGPVDPSAFKNITTGKADADDRILYKQSTGELFYDADGTGGGAKLKIAVLDNKSALFADDFLIV